MSIAASASANARTHHHSRPPRRVAVCGARSHSRSRTLVHDGSTLRSRSSRIAHEDRLPQQAERQRGQQGHEEAVLGGAVPGDGRPHDPRQHRHRYGGRGPDRENHTARVLRDLDFLRRRQHSGRRICRAARCSHSDSWRRRPDPSGRMSNVDAGTLGAQGMVERPPDEVSSVTTAGVRPQPVRLGTPRRMNAKCKSRRRRGHPLCRDSDGQPRASNRRECVPRFPGAFRSSRSRSLGWGGLSQSRMRIGTWNLAGRWSEQHHGFLVSHACDVWLLTEVNDRVDILEMHGHRTEAEMAPKRRWAAVFSRWDLEALEDPTQPARQLGSEAMSSFARSCRGEVTGVYRLGLGRVMQGGRCTRWSRLRPFRTHR